MPTGANFAVVNQEPSIVKVLNSWVVPITGKLPLAFGMVDVKLIMHPLDILGLYTDLTIKPV